MAIIVGDIHGNVEKVKAFLGYRPDQKHIALGDYVDSFHEPQERQIEALQLLLDSKSVLLFGNHDIHYLKTPPWYSMGFQWGKQEPLINLIEANKWRLKAACVADGWLCTHGGVCESLATNMDTVKLAKKLNATMKRFLKNPTTYQRINFTLPSPPIFNIGRGRGGDNRFGGIFWFDFNREAGLAAVKQIFGHTETKEPVVTENYVALDTTNNKENVYLFDTQTEKLVVLPMPLKIRKRCKECQNVVDFLNDDGTCTDCGRETGLYWGFADSKQFVVVQAETAKEAWTKAAAYWQQGQTITPSGILPLNAREISHQRNYTFDRIIWQTGPGTNDYFFDEMEKGKKDQ